MKKKSNNHKKLIAMILILLALFTTNIPVSNAATITCTYPLFSMSNTCLFVNDVIQLKSTVKIKSWSSSNTKVAVVTSNGRVQAKSGGTAKIIALDVFNRKHITTINVMYYMNSHIQLNNDNMVTGYFKSNITGRKFNLYNQMRVTGADWSGDCNRGVLSSILSGYDARKIGADDSRIINHIINQPDGLLYKIGVTNKCLDMFGLCAGIINAKKYIPNEGAYKYYSYEDMHGYIIYRLKAGDFICLHIMR